MFEPTTGYRLDFACLVRRVAVEVDGPTHFLRAPGGSLKENGKTAMKQRLLRAAGWRVLSVPTYAWKRTKEGNWDGAQRRAYIESLLSQIPNRAQPYAGVPCLGLESRI